MSRNNKRASANIWWIIIGAVIALVVVVVLLAIFTSKTGDVRSSLSDCESKSGICTSDSVCPRNTLKSTLFECTDKVSTCCIGNPIPYNPSDQQCSQPVSDVHGKQWCA